MTDFDYIFRTQMLEQVFYSLPDLDYFPLVEAFAEEGVTHVDGAFDEHGVFSFFGFTADGGFLSVECTPAIMPVRIWLR